jgi:hypothetical protein
MNKMEIEISVYVTIAVLVIMTGAVSLDGSFIDILSACIIAPKGL